MPTTVTVGESVKTNKRFTVTPLNYTEESNGSDEERGESEDKEYEPVGHGVGEDEESEEDGASPKMESKKNKARKSIKKNSKKRKCRSPKHGRKEKKRSPADPYPAQDEDPSTSGPPPNFQLVGISRSSSYSTTSIPDPEEEPPSRNLSEGMVNEGYVPAAPNREMEDVLREDPREDPEEGAGPGAHQLELVAQDRQPDQELHDTTSLQENQRGFIGPLRDPQRAGRPADAILPAANDDRENSPEPNEEGPEDLEEDQAGAESPAPQEEEEANQVVEDRGLQPLGWLEQYRGAQLFEEHPPHQEHARIREDDVPVLQQEMPRELVELHRGEELLLRGAIGEEMPLLRQEGIYIFEENGRRQEHYGVHQDQGALFPQERYEIFEDNVPVHHQEMRQELVELHREEDILLARLAHGEEMPRLHPDDLDLLEDNLPHQVNYGVHQDHGALIPQDRLEIFEDNVPVHHQEMPRELDELHRGEELLLPQGALRAEIPLLRQEDQEDILEDNVPRQEHFGVQQEDGALSPQDRYEIFEDNELVHQAEDVLQEGGVRWPGEVSLQEYLSRSGPLLPEEYFEIQEEM